MQRWKRTFLLVALLAATFAGWRWWTAPRIDPRLVGEWLWIDPSTEEKITVGLTLDGDVEVRSNWFSTPDQTYWTDTRSWSASYDTLILSSVQRRIGLEDSLSGRTTALWEWILDPGYKRHFPGFVRQVNRFEILNISEDRLELVSADGEHIQYQRVSPQ